MLPQVSIVGYEALMITTSQELRQFASIERRRYITLLPLHVTGRLLLWRDPSAVLFDYPHLNFAGMEVLLRLGGPGRVVPLYGDVVLTSSTENECPAPLLAGEVRGIRAALGG